MEKVFNDKIIEILCAKNLYNISRPLSNCEPNLIENMMYEERGGEKYVVFLNKFQRKYLKQYIKKPKHLQGTGKCLVRRGSGGDGRATPIASVHTGLVIKASSKTSVCDERLSIFTGRICRSVCSLGQQICKRVSFRNFRLDSRYELSKTDQDRRMPPVCGPFFDDPFCVTLDRLSYCISLALGYSLQPQEDSKDTDIVCLKRRN